MTLHYFPTSITGEAQVKQYYKVLCKFYHPDVPGGDNDIMQLINEEYNTLINNNYKHPVQPVSSKQPFVIGLGNNKFDLNTDEGVIDLIAHVIKNSRNK